MIKSLVQIVLVLIHSNKVSKFEYYRWRKHNWEMIAHKYNQIYFLTQISYKKIDEYYASIVTKNGVKQIYIEKTASLISG